MLPSLRHSSFAILLLTLTVSASSQAQEPGKKLLVVEDLYKFDGPREAVLAPDGKSAVYVRTS